MKLNFILIHLPVILFLSCSYYLLLWNIPLRVLFGSRITREYEVESKYCKLLKGVKVFSYKGIYPNSFSFGMNRVLITKNVIDSLNSNELKSLLYHHSRILKKGIFARFVILSVLTASLSYLLYLWTLKFVEPLSFNVDLTRALTISVIYFFSILLMRWFLNKSIIEADKFAILMNDKNSLINALQKLTQIGHNRRIRNHIRFVLMPRIRFIQKID